jgi:hypothetical protein
MVEGAVVQIVELLTDSGSNVRSAATTALGILASEGIWIFFLLGLRLTND